jgi:phosphate transport system protein
MNALDQDLQRITASTVRMLSLVHESTDLARRALIDAEIDAADLCVANDARVDEHEVEIEQRILTILARRQPAAKDLRFLVAIFRGLTAIERAGDYAVRVAGAGAELATEPPLKKYLDMDRILDILGAMIETTIRAIAESDESAARSVLDMDNEIDELYEQIQRELLTYMIEDPNTITAATRLLTVARSLERFGDHLENVNEHVLFWLTGERI